MKTCLTFFIVLITNAMATAQLAGDFKLPASWDREFTITLSNTGSMSGNTSKIRFTYDSMIYTTTSNQKGRKIKTYLLKEKDRVEILKKLHEQKTDQIKSEHSIAVVSDGWSTSLCFGYHCLEGGSSAEMSEDDKNAFLNVTRYLEEFALAKGGKH